MWKMVNAYDRKTEKNTNKKEFYGVNASFKMKSIFYRSIIYYYYYYIYTLLY